jgi:maleate isomerase
VQRRKVLQSFQGALVPISLAGSADGASTSRPEPSRAEPCLPVTHSPWRRDGWGWRGQLGLLMPHGDVEPESEFGALASDGVSLCTMRVRWVGVAGPDGSLTRIGADASRAFVESALLDDAVETMVDAPLSRPQAIALCFTGGSYVLGPDGDLALKARLERRSKGVPVALTTLAAVSALRAFGARRVAVVHPPWWVDAMDQRGAEYFERQGFDVVYHGRAPLRNDRGNVHPGPFYEWARANVPREAEAVFVGGNGMRTIGAIAALEEALGGRPVLTSNQVAFWGALRMAKIPAVVSGYGQLFDKQLPPA